MLLRLLSIVALLSAVHTAENPCKGKQLVGCFDKIGSCENVFPLGAGGVPNSKCFEPSGDSALIPFCYKTCQLCCLEPQFACDDDPIPTVGCPETQADCNLFGDINFVHCKATCGWCLLTDKPCVDAIDSTICRNFKVATGNLCSNKDVSSNCQRTCEVCIAPDSQDSSTRCPVWKENGFCTNEFYKAVRDTYCKKTCNE